MSAPSIVHPRVIPAREHQGYRHVELRHRRIKPAGGGKILLRCVARHIGGEKLFDHPSGGRLYGQRGAWLFGVLGPYDGASASCGNGVMLGFQQPTHEAVDAFHAKAIELGATDDGAPGLRGPGAYFAYVRDLDGNKICAYKFG